MYCIYDEMRREVVSLDYNSDIYYTSVFFLLIVGRVVDIVHNDIGTSDRVDG